MTEARELAVIEGGAGGGLSPHGGRVDLVAVARQAEAAKELGATLIRSGLLPDSIKKPEAAMVIMVKGAEMGLPPLYALSHISVVKGKPSMSAELMRALVHRAGHRFRIVESTRERATVEGERRDDPGHKTRISFDQEDVKVAGLGGQSGHKNYPAALKLARATSALCRAMFADAIGGVSYTPEELGDFPGEASEQSEFSAPGSTPVPEGGIAVEVEAEEAEEDHEWNAVLAEIEMILADLRPEFLSDKDGARRYAMESAENAVKGRNRLRQLLGQQQEADEDEPGDVLDDEEDDSDAIASVVEEEADEDLADPDLPEPVRDHEALKGAAKTAAKPKPGMARKSDISLMRTLAYEVWGEADAGEKLGEIAGKPLDELTRSEAQAVLDKLGEMEEEPPW